MDLVGYESREELIRDHWRRYGRHWDVNKWPRLKLPVRHKRYPYMPVPNFGDTPTPHIDNLEFSFERGPIEGRPFARIVCEGVAVGRTDMTIQSLARTIAKARHGTDEEAREAYYRHVRDNCGGWTYFASVHTSKSGREHEEEFHASRALIALPDGAQ